MSKTPFEKLWDFHTAFGQVRTTVPVLPGNDVRKLRRNLLREEFNEYVDGEENNDIVEIADALTDIIYIAYGTGVSYGLPMDEIFNEVHRSNMSKLGEDGKPVYREDGKVLKGPNYSRPDIASIVEAALAKAK
jgi:predicted HAD superfamily Cof-like phosphohydrolase